MGVAFVSLHEGIDATTPAGKLQMHILGAIAEFERARIAERVKAGLARAKAQGKTARDGRGWWWGSRCWRPCVASACGRRQRSSGCRRRRRIGG